MIVRTFVSGVALGVLASLLSCGPAKPPCGPSTCATCCSAAGDCIAAVSAVQCGGSGNLCQQCLPGQQCQFGLCSGQTGNGGTSGGGGGTTGGGSAQGGGGLTGGGGATGGGAMGGGAATGGGSAMGGGGATGGGTTQMRLFITSVTFPGNIGGLTSADTVCNTVARGALKGGTWKAWLSTSTENALTRMADVGPWVQQRSDGGTTLTFNNRANLGTTPLVPIGVDEFGDGTSNSFWTGTSGGGMSSGATCQTWADGTFNSNGTNGQANTTTTSWTSEGTFGCNNQLALLCLEQAAAPAPMLGSTRKRVFITSVVAPGNLGGLTGADMRCMTAAQAANKTGTWKAWLSTSAENAVTRQANVGPWYQERSDGGMTLTFNNRENLASTPLAPINVDELGRTTSNSFWTGTRGTGVSSGATCQTWSDGTFNSNGTNGQANTTSTSWTSEGTFGCNNQLALLCIEQ